jgi:hypothetical protein
MYSNHKKRVNARDEVIINDFKIDALFDSGCNTVSSLISYNIARKLNLMFQPTSHQLNTAKEGDSLQVIGEIVCEVTYRGVVARLLLYVVDGLNEDVIISFMDILTYFFVP